MYCRNCGKQIEDDSVFCKHCGKNVASRTTLTLNKGISTRFLKLSKSKQIVLIVYGIWFLGWLCVLIANAGSRGFAEDYVLPFFLYNFAFPFAILGGWHIYKIRKKDIDNMSSKVSTLHSDKSNIHHEKKAIKESPQIISSDLLLTFARNNGKMQIVNKKISDGEYDRFCQFTSEDGKIIRVDFSDRTSFLNSKGVSEMKYQLSVNKLTDGTYCLDFIENKQIDDPLPF